MARMNHDASHCSDYKPDECPISCYRAQLTEDLKRRVDLRDIPMSFAHFYGTVYCDLNRKSQ